MHSTRSVLSLIAIACLVAGCPSEADEPSGDEAPAEGSGAPTSGEAANAKPEQRPSGAAETVELQTADGKTLAATLRRGGRPQAPAVVLVHGLASDRSEWEPLVETLSEPPGLTTLAVDMRGHGDSEGGPDGWRDFGRDDWPAIGKDVVAAVGYLADDAHGLAPEHIVAVGASLGSSAVAVAAAEDDRIDAVALLSPGRAHRGVDAITPVDQLGARPLLALAAKGEQHSVQTATDMARIAERGTKKLCDGSAHGVAMLPESAELKDALVEFIRNPERAL